MWRISNSSAVHDRRLEKHKITWYSMAIYWYIQLWWFFTIFFGVCQIRLWLLKKTNAVAIKYPKIAWHFLWDAMQTDPKIYLYLSSANQKTLDDLRMQNHYQLWNKIGNKFTVSNRKISLILDNCTSNPRLS